MPRDRWKKGDYKSLNLPFENRLLAQPADIRERMAKRVEAFAYKMFIEVFNARDTAPLAIAAILKANSFDLGPKGTQIEDPAHWTEAQIVERAKTLDGDKGPTGNFDD